MTYLYEELSAPTRLYIKQCPHCGLKYFGKSIRKDIEKYPGSGIRWSRHLKKHKVNPVHLWNSDWYYDISITRFALKFSRVNKIVESESWANLKEENGLEGGFDHINQNNQIRNKINKTKSNPEWIETVSKEAARKRSKTMSDHNWQSTVGKDARKKEKETKSNPEWIETVGKEAARKRSEKRKDPRWIKTVGKEAARKQGESLSKTRNDPEWIKTVGKESIRKMLDTRNNPEWKLTTGKESSKKQSRKISKTKNDPKWKEKTYKTCNYCGKNTDPGNYKRWHGVNCKQYKERY